MSGAVDTKTVEMRFDNSNFEKNAHESISTLEKLKRALKLDGASSGLKEVEKASEKLDFKDTNRNIDSIGKHFNALEAIATGAMLKIGSKAADLGLEIASALTIKYPKMGWDKYEQKTEAVQTIMANLRDTQGKFASESAKMDYATYYLDKLMWFSDETSYSFTEMTSNLGKFVAVGQDLDTSVTAIQGIATWAAMAGQRSAGAARAMYNISQALGVGAMTTIDWKSIENANMATAEFKETAIAAAVAMGKLQEGQVTIESFRESLQKKWFDKDVMMSVFKTYGAAADEIQEYAKLNNTNVYDAIEALEAKNSKFAETLGFRAFKAAQEAKTFSEVVEATADAVSTKWLRIFENIFGNYQQAKKLWSDFAEDLYDVLAEPLNTLNEIMTRWNKGFFADGPKNVLEKYFESGKMDKLDGGIKYITKEMAELAVATDSAKYSIVTMKDGTKRLYRTIKDEKGNIKKFYKEIYEPEKGRKLTSGRENFLAAFKNLFDTVFHDVYDKNDKLEHMSFFGALKRGLQEVFLGTSDVDEIIPLVSRKIWEMTNAFKALTERLMPSMETSLKLKNVFKGLFTVFKMGGKFVKAVFKPFKDLFSRIFSRGENEKSILDIADAMGTWIQKLDEFLDKEGIYETVSTKIKSGLDLIEKGLNNVSVALTGMNIRELTKFLKDKLFAFFTNYDFKGLFNKVSGFFSTVFSKVSEAANNISKALTGKSIGELWTGLFDKIKNFDYAGTFDKVVSFFTDTITQLKQVQTGDLPEKITPLQKFALAVQKVFSAIKSFFTNIGPGLSSIGTTIKTSFTSIIDVFSGKKSLDKVVENRPMLKGLVDMFGGVVDFFKAVGPTLGKIGTFIGNFFRNMGNAIAVWAEGKSPIEIVESIIKGGFFISLSKFLTSIAKLASGLSGGFGAVKKVLKAYASEIKASALLDIALAIGIMAAAMYGLSKIEDMDKAAEGLMHIAHALGALMVLKELLSVGKEWFSGKFLSKKDSGSNGGPLANLKDMLSSVIGQSIFANDATAKFVKIALGILLAAAAAVLVVKAVQRMGEAIVSISKIPESQIKTGGERVAQIVALFGIFAFLSGWSTHASSALFAAIGALILVKAIAKLIDVLADLGSNNTKMQNIKKVGEKFKGVFEALQTAAKWVIAIAGVLAIIQIIIAAFARGTAFNAGAVSKALKQFGKNFLRIAASMVILVGAIALFAFAMSKLDIRDVTVAALTLGLIIVLIGLVSALVVGISNMSVDVTGKGPANVLKQFGKMFTRIAISLAIVVGALMLLSRIKVGPGLAVVEELSAFLGIFVLVTTLLAVIAAIVAGVGGTLVSHSFAKNLAMIAVLFVAVAGSLLMVAYAFKLLGEIKYSSSESSAISIIVMALFMIVVAILTAAAVLIADCGILMTHNFLKAIGAISVLFLAVAGSLLIVANAYKMLSELRFGEGGATIGQITTAFGVFIALTGAIGILAGVLIKGVTSWIGIVAVAGLMVVTALSLMLVANAFKQLSESITPEELLTCTIVLIALGVIVGLLAAIGGALGAIPAGAGIFGMLAIAAVILAFGAACWIAAKGIEIGANAIENFMKTVALYGPAFNASFGQFSKIFVKGFASIIAILSKLEFGQMVGIALVLVALGAACLLAGVGIGYLVRPISTLMAAIVGFIDVVADKGSKFVEGFKTAFNGFLDTIIEGAPKIKESVKTIVSSLLLGIAENVGNIAAVGLLIPLAIASGFAKGLAASLPPLLQSFTTSLDTILDAVDELGPELMKAGDRLILQLVAGMAQALQQVPKLSKTIQSYLWDILLHGDDAKSIYEHAKDNGIDFENDGKKTIKERIAKDKKEYEAAQEKAAADNKKRLAKATDAELLAEAKDIAAKNAAKNKESIWSKLFSIPDDPDLFDVNKIFEGLKKQRDEAAKELGSSDLTSLFSGELGDGVTLPVNLDWSNIGDVSGFLDSLQGLSDNKDFNEAITSYKKTMGAATSKGAQGMVRGIETEKALLIQNGTEMLSQMSDIYSGSIEGVDVVGPIQSKMTEFSGAITDNSYSVTAASGTLANAIPGPIQALDSSTWGADIGSGLAAGIMSKISEVAAAAAALAAAIHDVLGFSEPKKGPLSDFHTYAPDMVRLWCSGVYGNLGLVKASSSDMANAMSEGVTSALDYVSGLIDGGMSDDLTIRPVIDLSEIQNGAAAMSDIMSKNSDYTVTGTARMAASAAAGMSQTSAMRTPEPMSNVEVGGSTNTFYITSNNADEVAEKVSKILGAQTRRKKAVWAKA